MWSIYEKKNISTSVIKYDWTFKSTDELRTDLPDGTMALQIDTGIYFVYDEETKTWFPQNQK